MEKGAYKKDIFISYCHADNQNILGAGWIEQFHKLLRVRLKQITGAREPEQEVGIWRDKELQENQEFANVLVQEINKVRIVISILSPSYLASEWCLREIKTFIKATERQGGLLVDNQARIFKVLKTPVDRNAHPEALRGQMGYQFYLIDNDTQIPQEFTLLKGDANNTLALQKINDIAYNIIKLLKTLDKIKIANDTVSKPIVNDAPCVYLAETSFDLSEQQKAVRRELEAWGYRVLPEGELPIRNPNQFRAAVEAALQQSLLSIHMVGEHRSVGVAGETADSVELQNRLAAQWSIEHPLQRLIWLPKDLSVEDSGQQQLIRTLQTDSQAQINAEVLEVAHHELLSVIHDTLDKQRLSNTDTAPENGLFKIYVIYAYEDNEKVLALTDYLFNHGNDVLEPLADDQASDQQTLEIHKRNLADCDAAIIFAGSGGEFWLKMQLSELQRAAALRDAGKDLNTVAIYRAPDSSLDKRRIRSHYPILEGQQPFQPDVLSEFIGKLGAQS